MEDHMEISLGEVFEKGEQAHWRIMQNAEKNNPWKATPILDQMGYATQQSVLLW